MDNVGYFLIGFAIVIALVFTIKMIVVKTNSRIDNPKSDFLDFVSEGAETLNDELALLVVFCIFVWMLWPALFLLIALLYVIYLAGKIFKV